MQRSSKGKSSLDKLLKKKRFRKSGVKIPLQRAAIHYYILYSTAAYVGWKGSSDVIVPSFY